MSNVFHKRLSAISVRYYRRFYTLRNEDLRKLNEKLYAVRDKRNKLGRGRFDRAIHKIIAKRISSLEKKVAQLSLVIDGLEHKHKLVKREISRFARIRNPECYTQTHLKVFLKNNGIDEIQEDFMSSV